MTPDSLMLVPKAQSGFWANAFIIEPSADVSELEYLAKHNLTLKIAHTS